MDIPRKLRKYYGVNVIPLDFLPITGIDVDRHRAQHVLELRPQDPAGGALRAATATHLHLIYMTNFKCGPDSYIKHYVREASGKPFLTLQFDEHQNDAGAMTRCEAYLDSKGFLRWWSQRRGDAALRARRRRSEPWLAPRRHAAATRSCRPPSATSASRAARCTCRRCPTAAATCWPPPSAPSASTPGRRSDSDERTLELGGSVTSGDECYPQKITVGDFLRIIEDEGRDKVALPHAHGQRAVPLRPVHATSCGARSTSWATTTCRSSPSPPATATRPSATTRNDLVRTGWRAVVAQDILMKMLLKTRPYEVERGATDAAYQAESGGRRRGASAATDVSHKAAAGSDRARPCVRARDRFRAVACRLRPARGRSSAWSARSSAATTPSPTSTSSASSRSRAASAGCADIGEWVWYTDDEHGTAAGRRGARATRKDNAVRELKAAVQRRDEQALYEPFAERVRRLRGAARRARGARGEPARTCRTPASLGEMVLSIGKAIYLHGKGVDGIIDISPFTCMNGIVTEAVYPRCSATSTGMPIRTFYFDGTQADLDRDVGIFLELAQDVPAAQEDRAPLPVVLRQRHRLSARAAAALAVTDATCLRAAAGADAAGVVWSSLAIGRAVGREQRGVDPRRGRQRPAGAGDERGERAQYVDHESASCLGVLSGSTGDLPCRASEYA